MMPIMNLLSSPAVYLSMTTQEWIVAFIVLLCLVEVRRRVIRFFRSTKRKQNPCANCTTGCDLKRMFDEKQQECKGNDKKNKKKCCG